MAGRDPIDDLIDDLKSGLILALSDGRVIEIKGKLFEMPKPVDGEAERESSEEEQK